MKPLSNLFAKWNSMWVRVTEWDTWDIESQWRISECDILEKTSLEDASWGGDGNGKPMRW